MSWRRSFGLLLLSSLSALGCSSKNGDAEPCGTDRACSCPVGDPDCSPCEPGYRTSLVGTSCVPTCNAPSISCGEHGTCEETAQGAECVCEPGYTGESCSSCANGLSLNANEQCFGKLSAPSLLTLSSVDQQVILGALVPPAWSFLPLSTAPSTLTDVAYDSRAGSVYGLDDGRLSSIDLSTGKVRGLSPAGVDLGSALCLDEAGGRAFTASSEAIFQVDLQTYEVSTLAEVGASALEYDAARGLVVGVDITGKSFELAGSEALALGQAPALEELGMAFDGASGRAYFVGSEPESEEARLLRYCAGALSRLGAIAAWQTRLVDDVPESATLHTVDYAEADSALIVVPVAETQVGSVRVTTGHPDAAVCIVAEGGSTSELTVEVTSAARARFIVVAAADRRVALDVTQLADDGGAHVIVHTDEVLTVAGSSSSVTEYDGRAWVNLGLTTLAGFRERPASQLVLMDWSSQATLPETLAQPLYGSALAWVGKVP